MSSTKEQRRRRDYYYNELREHFGDDSDSWFGDGSDYARYFNSIGHVIKSRGREKVV